jgi:predicted small lipoprotein YifL
MKRAFTSLLLIGTLATLSGCPKPAYVVAPSHEETRRDRLDAEWFTREISDGAGLQAIELVYCPIQPSTPTVCRTAVVWRRDQSALTETAPWK